MSVTNDSGINFAENRTLRAFVLLYGVMAFLILALIGTIYYRYSEELMLSTHRLSMQIEAESYIPRVMAWKESGANHEMFPKDIAYKTALYTKNGTEVVSYFDVPLNRFTPGIYREDAHIHFLMAMGSYGMKEMFLVFETQDDGLWLREMWMSFLLYGSLLFIALLSLGIALSRLFIRPMREAVLLLDNFIKDTTHELNTPVSTIVTNVETIDQTLLDEKTRIKIRRIDISAKTIASIYDDLTYLILHHKIAIFDEPLEIKEIVQERLAYFNDHFVQKQLVVSDDLSSCLLTIDRTKLTRVIDNLLSNAIKYNKRGGTIDVVLDETKLQVSDSGKGIASEKLEHIFDRYSRFDKSVGGFGIGLHIVASIVKEYGFKVEVESRPNKGTTITIFWQR
ncbi:MAG: HAMP domain-containing sensor histidine kinase [Helicobacteraceae bacterium]|nr:HAMP domain-containing sensor histidine kinase [Helicobacteraceae bacterium]